MGGKEVSVFAKTGKAIVNLAATERIRLLKDTLEFYGLDGSVHTRVNFPTPEEAERAFQLLALELKAKGQLLMALQEAE